MSEEGNEKVCAQTTQDTPPDGVPCQVFSRVVGYLSPVQGWHAGKQQEWKERRTFNVEAALDDARS